MHKTCHDHIVVGLTFMSLRVKKSEQIRKHYSVREVINTARVSSKKWVRRDRHVTKVLDNKNAYRGLLCNPSQNDNCVSRRIILK